MPNNIPKGMAQTCVHQKTFVRRFDRSLTRSCQRLYKQLYVNAQATKTDEAWRSWSSRSPAEKCFHQAILDPNPRQYHGVFETQLSEPQKNPRGYQKPHRKRSRFWHTFRKISHYLWVWQGAPEIRQGKGSEGSSNNPPVRKDKDKDKHSPLTTESEESESPSPSEELSSSELELRTMTILGFRRES